MLFQQLVNSMHVFTLSVTDLLQVVATPCYRSAIRQQVESDSLVAT
jgi:hypothetical protein